MNDKLVRIAQYENSEQAHVAKMELEGEGIEGFIENENLATAGLVFTLPTCEVHLLVRESQAKEARQILQDFETEGPAVDESGKPVFDEDED
jgi:hypothetical protein